MIAMGKFSGVLAIGASGLMFLAGCSAARDIKDAANGIKNAEKDIKDLEARVARSKELTYTATYEVKNKDGTTEDIVVAQKPPKSAYTQGGTQVIDDGEKVVSCTKRGGKDECQELGPHTDAGLYGAGFGFSFAFNPATFTGLYTAAAILPGVDASKSTREIAGQKSECVSIKATRGSDSGKSFSGCTTDDGIFTYSDDGDGSVVTMKRFDKQADDSLFEAPAPVRSPADLGGVVTSTTSVSGSTSTSLSPGSSSTSTSTPSSTSSTSSISPSSTSTTLPGGTFCTGRGCSKGA